MTEVPSRPPAVEMIGIHKRFGAVLANADVHLAVRSGTVHGIVGENGAGKSTLMSVLYGFYSGDSGSIRVDGQGVAIRNSHDAIALGIRPSPGDYKMTLSTANGTVKGARVTLREVRLGSILVRNVEAVVLPEGALSMSLLGTSVLAKLRGYEVQTGRMILRG